jgi:uncharacterized protein DUF6092
MLTEDEALDLLALLVTSARTQVDEAAAYGPLRLLLAAERLSGVLADRGSPETRAFAGQTTQAASTLAMRVNDRDALVAGLDELCAGIAEVLVARAQDAGRADG